MLQRAIARIKGEEDGFAGGPMAGEKRTGRFVLPPEEEVADAEAIDSLPSRREADERKRNWGITSFINYLVRTFPEAGPWAIDRLGSAEKNDLWEIMYKMNRPLKKGQDARQRFVFLTEDDMHNQAVEARKIYFMERGIWSDEEDAVGGGRMKKSTRKKSNRRKPIKRKSTRRKTIKRKSLRRKSIKRKSTKKKSKKRRR